MILAMQIRRLGPTTYEVDVTFRHWWLWWRKTTRTYTWGINKNGFCTGWIDAETGETVSEWGNEATLHRRLEGQRALLLLREAK